MNSFGCLENQCEANQSKNKNGNENVGFSCPDVYFLP